LAEASDAINACVKEPIDLFERAAYTDIIFNLGGVKFCGSTMVKKLNRGDHIGACNEIPRWIYADNKDCRIVANDCYGIVKRRADEKGLCLVWLQ